MSNVSLLSAISIPVDLYKDEILLGPATAFFYIFNGENFLISNWHVFSGRNSQTGQPLHSSGAIPNHMKVKIHAAKIGDFHYGLNLSLQNEKGNPTWLQHSAGQEYDIACIRINPPPPEQRFYTIDDHGESQLAVSVGIDVMIIGFPRALAAQGIWPIWKRGTLASEPHIERIDKLPIYLVDAASREGMSGSPVYIYSSGVALAEDGSVGVYSGPVARFIGVYSGRYGDEANMQLGRVWKRTLLEEMCRSPAEGSYIIRKL